jgi:NRPS condensation-like uncharacterized protein
VDNISGRFPYFSVSLVSGFFWYYLEYINKPPRIHPDVDIPCIAFAVSRKGEPLYRVLARENRISVEFIHILTDGGGAFEYFKSLLYTYLNLTGSEIKSADGIKLPGTPVSEEEYEDGYLKFFSKLPPPRHIAKAWHVPFTLNEKPRLKNLRAQIPVDDILREARKYNVSITEYMTAVYLFSLQKIYLDEKAEGHLQKRHVIRCEVPVNMRNKYPSRTMRNFSLFVMPEIDLRLGIYDFDEVVRSVHYQIRADSETKQITRFMSSNVHYEKLLMIRILPLFVKRMAIAAIYRGLGSRKSSGIITNLGNITFPGNMDEFIDSIQITPTPPNTKVRVTCALVSYKGVMNICFANLTAEKEVEKNMLTHLASTGIKVKITDIK